MRCNVVFEGGGAKGIAHIGALKAIESYGLKIDKVAGTSAGAIIACLVALGYSADELYDPVKGKGKLPQDLKDVIFPDFLSKIWVIAKIILTILIGYGSFLLFIPIGYFAYSVLTFFLTFVLSLSFFNLSKKIKRHPKVKVFFRAVLGSVVISSAALIVFPLILPATILFWGFGLIPTSGVEKWLSDIISSSPVVVGSGGKLDAKSITFEKLYQMSGCDLKLISSDIGTKEITIFSHDNPKTKDLPLIDGVIASICIPLFFKCKKITIDKEVYQFVDGGMLSNFPAWSYRKHLLFDELKHTLGIKLSPEIKIRKDVDNPITYMKNMAITALWGASAIENISVKGLNIIRINTGKVGTFSFGLNPKQVSELYDTSFRQTLYGLIDNYSIFPDGNAEKWLSDISGFFVRLYRHFLMDKRVTKTLENATLGKIDSPRACLIATVDHTLDISKIIYHHNMSQDLDRHLEFDFMEGVAGVSLSEGIPLIYLPEHNRLIHTKKRSLSRKIKSSVRMNPNRQALVKTDLKIIVAIPIFSIADLIAHEIVPLDEPDKHAPERVHNIDFKKVYFSGVKAKAVLAIDFSDYFLYDGLTAVPNELYETEFNQHALGMFSYIASKAISKLSADVAAEETR
ncbi:patatin-like phospholipase family protein [Enterovibrio sp. ZSDZ35]|uniref:Patatin-like phospholipase family protein n=1 Tax=Enterovibrio qingdaonensis TaxID=2899818 RepID=A0ABT5QK56_9GAMM|nr:patatin-like phospholipase family protein [Enterovibrio sp. ZSDZ35]MDD1781375.1 patatin-like phospholipase family protein [Enterovibrio sp. ZSDZ35]